MKAMKNLFLTALACLLAASLGLHVKATGSASGTITIHHASQGTIYQAYKLFDAAVLSDGSIYYSVQKDSAAYTAAIAEGSPFIVSSAGFANEKGGTSYALSVAGAQDETLLKSWFELHFVQAVENGQYVLKDNLVYAGTAQDYDANTGTMKISNLEPGYYFVTSSLGAAVVISALNQSVDVYEKYDENFHPSVSDSLKTVRTSDLEGTAYPAGSYESSTSATIGDTITYKIEFVSANYDSQKRIEKYVILDNSLSVLKNLSLIQIEFEKDGAITAVSPEELEENDIGFCVNEDEKGFTLSLNNWSKRALASGTSVRVYYSVLLAGTYMQNEAKVLAYYQDEEEPKESDPSSTIVTTHDLTIYKTDGAAAPLEGAQFELYADADCSQRLYVKDNEDGTYTITTEESEIEKDVKILANNGGMAKIKGLALGSVYYLLESQAPSGYVASQAAIASDEIVEEDDQNELTIINTTNIDLPSTGGSGTHLLYIDAIVLISVAALGLTYRKYRIF